VESIFTFRPDQTSRITLQVSDQCGQHNTDTLDVFVYDPELEVHLPADTSICLGNKLELVPVVSGAIGSISYFWPVSGGSQAVYSLIPQRNNRFTVVVEDECKRTAEASVEVQVIDVNASFEFNYDFPDQPVTNLSSPQCIYQWTFPDGSFSNLENPVYDPNQNENGAVVLHVQDENGCEDSVLKFFEPPMQLYIPTAFTPDGNGKNDLFKAEGQHIADFHIWIFDKWGNLVFESTDINQAWDGRGTRRDDHFAGANIFVYRCVARSWTGAVKEGHGTITLLR
jgi:gliding motility-associated-like protein